MKDYIEHRGWTLEVEFEEVGLGAKTRPKCEELLKRQFFILQAREKLNRHYENVIQKT